MRANYMYTSGQSIGRGLLSSEKGSALYFTFANYIYTSGEVEFHVFYPLRRLHHQPRFAIVPKIPNIRVKSTGWNSLEGDWPITEMWLNYNWNVTERLLKCDWTAHRCHSVTFPDVSVKICLTKWQNFIMLKQYGEKKKGIKQQTWYSQGKYRVWNVTRKKENIDKDMLVWRNIYKNKHINEKKGIWLYTCLRKKRTHNIIHARDLKGILWQTENTVNIVTFIKNIRAKSIIHVIANMSLIKNVH